MIPPAAMEPTSPHLLVVDDHREIRELLARYLAKHGFRVSAAENAAAARRQLQTGAFDLVVLDVMMPGEDGLSLCRHLRETAPAAPRTPLPCSSSPASSRAGRRARRLCWPRWTARRWAR